jgi:hypothetical protein
VTIAGLDPPDFRTVSDFRKRHLNALAGLFAHPTVRPTAMLKDALRDLTNRGLCETSRQSSHERRTCQPAPNPQRAGGRWRLERQSSCARSTS